MVPQKVSVPGTWPETSDCRHLPGRLSRLREAAVAHGQSDTSQAEPRCSFPVPQPAAPPWGSVTKWSCGHEVAMSTSHFYFLHLNLDFQR